MVDMLAATVISSETLFDHNLQVLAWGWSMFQKLIKAGLMNLALRKEYEDQFTTLTDSQQLSVQSLAWESGFMRECDEDRTADSNGIGTMSVETREVQRV